MTIPKGNYPNAFYRVSLKAIIRNDQGEVLLVKEKGSGWSLPGGGMDHGETPETALARELYEEALIQAPFDLQCIGVNPRFVKAVSSWWLLWVVYEVTVREPYAYGKGVDADEVAFINPQSLKNSMLVSEKLAYKWCVDQSFEANTY
jgi:ADP-ribose pyrophosphatase YjhB (NUDIX family)